MPKILGTPKDITTLAPGGRRRTLPNHHQSPGTHLASIPPSYPTQLVHVDRSGHVGGAGVAGPLRPTFSAWFLIRVSMVVPWVSSNSKSGTVGISWAWQPLVATHNRNDSKSVVNHETLTVLLLSLL